MACTIHTKYLYKEFKTFCEDEGITKNITKKDFASSITRFSGCPEFKRFYYANESLPGFKFPIDINVLIQKLNDNSLWINRPSVLDYENEK